MTLATVFNDFIAFSVLGWIYECLYCTIRTGHWQNRGFLFGPICPIYGVGALLILLLAVFVPDISNDKIPLWELYLIFLFGSAMLEYSVSWGLERIFHARWWDYSGMPFNVNGRICLPASAFFGVAGVLFFEYLMPFACRVHAQIYPWANEAAALVMMGLLGADTALSVASMSALLETLENMESSLNAKMENGVQIAKQIPGKVSHTSEKALNTVSDASGRAKDTMLLISCHAKDAATHMLQRHHLKNISRFVKNGHSKAADYIKLFMSRKDNDK